MIYQRALFKIRARIILLNGFTEMCFYFINLCYQFLARIRYLKVTSKIVLMFIFHDASFLLVSNYFLIRINCEI